ncbi:hypothetical protein [Streptomyces sp. NBC_00258]|uniref:hypothetical protein n=1 Tax=Streptomyces sp. NBC_00258 TaxID=2903642 RepID=UPI002E2B1964|nr:hypothetical protein [Streptomyces sp. NBC_00258]
MAHRRRKPTPRHAAATTPADPQSPRKLWHEAGRRAVLGFAGSTGAATVALLEWWLRTR